MNRIALTLMYLLIMFSLHAQEGQLVKRELFRIDAGRFEEASGFTFKVAVDSKEHIAFNACSLPYVYIFNKDGALNDSLKLPGIKCIRAMEFSENDDLLVMDNDEKNIYRYNLVFRKLETLPYNKPEDWFVLLNHYYKNFEISSIPTYYSNNDYLQDFYFTRFAYSYNLFLNYKNGYIYQAHYNFIKKINNHKSYVNLKREDYWFSDNITPKSKLLMIDDEAKWVIYYDRFYNLIYENFANGKVVVNAALNANSEPARFDYAVNITQDMIYGISSFSKKEIVISCWRL